MKTKKIIFILTLLFVAGSITQVQAQDWLERLGKRAEETAKRKIERKVDEKVDKTVDNAFEKAENNVPQGEKKGKAKKTIIEPPETGTPAENTSDWDNNEPYYGLKKGTRIEYTIYDGKGKVQGLNTQEVMDITRTKNSVNATVTGVQTNAKGKVESSGTVSLKYSNGYIYANLLDMAALQGLENMEIDANMSGSDMMIPSKLKPGQILPDARLTFKMKMKSGKDEVDMPPVEFRIINRRAVRAESVDTPMGKFVCFKITQTMEADYPIIGTQYFTDITWIGKGFGVVKSESYDSKGKLKGRMLLTKLE